MFSIYQQDSITWVRHGTRDQWNEPAAATDVAIKARVDWRTKLVIDWNGEQVLASGSVILDSKPDHEDNLEINSISHIIIAVEEIKSFSKVLGYRAYFQ
jgi:hypothetical protein